MCDDVPYNVSISTPTPETVAAMKEGAKTMKQEFKKVNIDKVEDLQDDMEDLLDEANEIQDVMARSYGNADELDEDELDAELDALGSLSFPL